MAARNGIDMESGYSPNTIPIAGYALLSMERVSGTATVELLLARAGARYGAVSSCSPTAGSFPFPGPGLPRGRFVPTASSLSMDAVLGDDEIRRSVENLGVALLGPLVRSHLQGPLVIDLDQAWFRRQFAPGNYPPVHSPHSWHQDGALGYDFLGNIGTKPQLDDLLEMLTCWIALTPCGAEAPGLELVAQPIDRLLQVAELNDQTIRATYAAEQFVRPVMAAGDALVFPGGTLHRTYVDASMTRDRTSLELRFFPADRIPKRLSGDRFLPVPEL